MRANCRKRCLFLKLEFAGQGGDGHVPGSEEFGGEFHAVGGLELSQQRLTRMDASEYLGPQSSCAFSN
jgi:hypothetical protein